MARTVSLLLIAALAVSVAARGSPFNASASTSSSGFKNRNLFVFDGHNDVPWRYRAVARGDVKSVDFASDLSGAGWQTDIPRLIKGGVKAQFWSVYIDCKRAGKDAVRAQLEQIDMTHRLIEAHPHRLALATTVKEVQDSMEAGKIASLLGMEGGHAIDSSLGALRMFYRLGVRYMTLNHNCYTRWSEPNVPGSLLSDGDDVAPPVYNFTGLTAFGKDVIREMNRIGMFVDISHVSYETMVDVLDTSTAPVIFSHSSAWELCNHPRNVKDDILRKLKVNRGVIMVVFFTGFVTCAPYEGENNVMAVVDHIAHIASVAGIESVGIGSDFDGVPNDQLPDGLSDVSMYPNLEAALLERGFSQDDVEKIFHANVLRAMNEAEREAERLQRVEDPSPELLDVADGCRTDYV